MNINRRFALVAGVIAVVVAVVVAALVMRGDDDVADVEAFDLRVGIVTSFTGDLSAFGEPLDQAARIAADLINESLERVGLSDVSLTVAASEDDQTQATAGVEAATKLVQSDRVSVIVGSLASAVTIPIAESVAIPNRVVMISPASTSPAITDLADDGFVWRTPPSDALQGQVLAEAMANEFGADATINTGTRNDAYGTALIGVFEEAWRENGGTIGRSVRWNPEAPTFDSEAQQLAGGSPDGWLIIDFPETWARVGPALVRAGGWDPFATFTADGLRSSTLPAEVGDQATEGMRGTAPTSEGAPAGEAFDRVFTERAPAGVERQTFDAQAFDAVIVSFLAALRAGSSDPEAIRDNLQAVTGPPGAKVTFEQLDDAIRMLTRGEEIDYEGASGPIDFDANGDPGAALYEIWRFQDGELVTEDTVTFGEESA